MDQRSAFNYPIRSFLYSYTAINQVNTTTKHFIYNPPSLSPTCPLFQNLNSLFGGFDHIKTIFGNNHWKSTLEEPGKPMLGRAIANGLDTIYTV